MIDEKSAHIADIRERQAVLDSKRCELDELICATAREKDEIHHSARELQSQVDAAHHNLVFARDSQQRLADLHRLQCELKLQKETLHG